MRVLYDISWLGYSSSRASGPTGLDRVIETIGCELATAPECELTLCAADSFGAVVGALDYRKQKDCLARVPFTYSRIDYAYQVATHRLVTALSERETKNYFTRAVRMGLREGCKWASRYRSSLGSESLSQSDVYHSPFLALPEATRRGRQLKRFLTVSDLIPLLFPEFSPDGAAELLSKALRSLTPEDFVFCISQATKNDLCNHVPWLDSERVIVTYLAADDSFCPIADTATLARARSKYGIPAGKYFLTLGSLQPRKGMEFAIECFRNLLAESKLRDVYLVIAGPRGWKDSAIIEAATKDERTAGQVILTGRIDDSDLPALYGGATGLLFPSLYEGFGLPVVEAMQCGTPVIAANTSSLPEVIGEAGLLVPPRDSDALCAAMFDLLNDENRREELIEKGLARARDFSWRRCRDETIAGYRLALGQVAAAK